MSEKAKRAISALTTYLERGRAALASLEQGRFDDANETLRLQKAAFHNFKAIDILAQRDGNDIASDPEAQALWTEIRALELKLREALLKAKAETAEIYNKIREAQAKIGAYRSKRRGNSKFEKTA